MEVRPVPETPADFRASISRVQIAFLGISYVCSDSHEAARTHNNISLYPADYYKISYQLQGQSLIIQDGRTGHLSPGHLSIYDTGRPYQLVFSEPSTSIVVQIPHSEFHIDPALIGRITASPLSSTIFPNDSLRKMLMSLIQDRRKPRLAVDYQIARGLAELLTAAVLSETPTGKPPSPARDSLLGSLKRFAGAHIGNSRLSLDDVASAHHISPRTAQRMFHNSGETFSGWLRSERLERSRTEVTESDKPITRIAHECGFASATHFSKLFRQRFGTSALKLRSENQSEDPTTSG